MMRSAFGSSLDFQPDPSLTDGLTLDILFEFPVLICFLWYCGETLAKTTLGRRGFISTIAGKVESTVDGSQGRDSSSEAEIMQIRCSLVCFLWFAQLACLAISAPSD